MLLFRNRLSNLIYSKRLFSVHQLIYQEYGNPTEVLKFCEKEFDADKLEKNQVHIKWLASPINPADLNQIQGVYPVKPTLPAVGGNEGCAKIIKIGSEVIGLKNDDLVIPSTTGIGTWSTCGIYESKDFFKINADPKDFIFLSMLQVYF